jgi:hypothetical protein
MGVTAAAAAACVCVLLPMLLPVHEINKIKINDISLSKASVIE